MCASCTTPSSAAILAEGGLIDEHHLALQGELNTSQPTTNLIVAERETIAKVLRETRWNKAQAARRLGLSRTQLYVRMRKYGINEPPPIA
jgi:transcriptional regulator of acetoin/glycerol metabolism